MLVKGIGPLLLYVHLLYFVVFFPANEMMERRRMKEEMEDRRYQPSGRGVEGPEEGSIMSSEVTLYLHPPLLSGPGIMEHSTERGMNG